MNAISPLAKTIPESVFMLYQMTFAVITVALVAGSVADRMRFSAYLWFVAGWLLLVYVPIAHWVWGGGFLGTAGVLDFAGGTGRASERRHRRAGRLLSAGRAARLRHRQSGALRSVARRDRHRPVVGRLVRLQRRLRARRQLARRLRRRRNASRRMRRRAHLDDAGVVGSRQAVGARHDLRRGRRAWHHHAGLGVRAAVARHRHRHRRRRGLLLGLHQAQDQMPL